MKLKTIPMLVGALMFAAAIPVAAQACPGSNGQRDQQLTPQQQSGLEQIQRSTVQQVEAILTPEQQQQFQAALGQGQKMPTALSNLNLSSQQQSQLQEIMRSSKAQKQQLFNSNRV